MSVDLQCLDSGHPSPSVPLASTTGSRERKCAGSSGWPFPLLKYIFQLKYSEAILSDSTWKLLWREIAEMRLQF